MDRVKITIVGVILGILYAFISVPITGIGAAIYIPASILDPLIGINPTFAFAVVDLITIGIPLIIVYFVFVLVINYFNASKSYIPYLVLLIPFIAQHIYFFIIMGLPQDWDYTLAKIIPRYIAITAISLYFVKRAVNQTKT